MAKDARCHTYSYGNTHRMTSSVRTQSHAHSDNNECVGLQIAISNGDDATIVH